MLGRDYLRRDPVRTDVLRGRCALCGHIAVPCVPISSPRKAMSTTGEQSNTPYTPPPPPGCTCAPARPHGGLCMPLCISVLDPFYHILPQLNLCLYCMFKP